MARIQFDILVVVLPERSLRYECASGQLMQQPRSAGMPPEDAVARVLAAKPCRRRRILVAGSEFYAQRVALTPAQTAGLSVEELRTLLFFEVEPFSNLSPATSMLAYCEQGLSDGMRAWQVLQLANSEIAAMRAAMQAAGAQLAGFTLADQALLTAADAALPQILAEFCTAAQSQPATVPLLIPPVIRKFSGKPEFLTLVLVTFVLLGCWQHHSVHHQRLRRARGELRQCERLDYEIKQAESNNAVLQTQLAERHAQQQSLEAVQHSLERYRNAWPVLLQALLDACGPALVIREINGADFFEAKISGFSTDAQSPGAFIAHVAQAVRTAGWEIHSDYQQDALKGDSAASVHYGFCATLALPEGVRQQPEPLPDEVIW